MGKRGEKDGEEKEEGEEAQKNRSYLELSKLQKKRSRRQLAGKMEFREFPNKRAPPKSKAFSLID